MLSTNNKNFKILALAISALIVGVEAQVTCTSSSPQCCWVVRSWQLMGKAIPTGVKSTDNSCCTVPMSGVSCDSTKTKVTGLDWSFKNLTGSILAEFGKLTSLTYLLLRGNLLSGSIVSSIGNSTSLMWLDLSSNQLSGSIPAQIGDLKGLTGLYLSRNQLSGSIPAEIGNLKSLTWLDLQSNQLSGPIPSEIGNLGNLRNLYLPGNQLSGPIPSEIVNLGNLRNLYISMNQLSGQIPEAMGNLTKLQTLDLSYNPLLNGTFSPNCVTQVYATNTLVTLCGCATSGSPAARYPPAGTSLECLSTGLATPFGKRALLFSQNIRVSNQVYMYTCNNDTFGNPYQDCLNALGAICHKDYIALDQSLIKNCKDGIDQMTRGLSYHWRNVRKACGQWSFDGAEMGPYNASNCAAANNELQKYAFTDGISPVTAALTDSVIEGLWSRIF